MTLRSRPALAVLVLAVTACGGEQAPPPPAPSLSVSATTPVQRTLPQRLPASGSVQAWEEMSLGVEVSGQRVAEVLVEVGANVTADQPLLRLDTRSLAMARRQSEAAVAQADAQLVVARANAKRAGELRTRGLVSARDAEEAWAAEENAKAQHRTAGAALAAARLQEDFAELRAPDAGVISWRGVQPGQVVTPGAELLRLIRQGRLEWRAELSERELIRIAPGAVAVLRGPDGSEVQGRVRQVSPALDPVSRTGLVYVDLPAPGALRAGMFAQGELRLGETSARTVPHAAVVERDGYRYVFVLGADGVVAQRRVETGARDGDVVEIRDGLADGERIALEGAAFLSDGDRVKVVEAVARGREEPSSQGPASRR